MCFGRQPLTAAAPTGAETTRGSHAETARVRRICAEPRAQRRSSCRIPNTGALALGVGAQPAAALSRRRRRNGSSIAAPAQVRSASALVKQLLPGVSPLQRLRGRVAIGGGAVRSRNHMNRDVCIHAWPCSYYLESEKQWVPGKLSLMPLSLKFTADKTGETLVSFPLSSVTEIKKEASHFIFSSITVLEKDCLKHWFSSLQPNRNAAFSTIEHFWRALLLSGPPAEAQSSPMTEGKKLTALMACSQKRLEDTSRVLHHQGEQLDGIARDLDRMESDLDVTDR
ncbi:hypothetical protein MC885_015126 [Smutsia gigantea]|nr:hypothetical protein MC885_015126 [Smutsia gigantea]